MSNDSIDQWNQATTGHYNDWHPVFHTLYVWLWMQFGHTPASVAIAQIVLMGLTVGWFVYELERFSIPSVVLWISAVILAVAPANGVMALTLWKDVPFAIAILALTALLLRTANTQGNALRNNRWIAALAILCSLVGLFRHNGVATSVGTVLGLFLAYPRHWKKTGLAAALGLLIAMGIRGPLYDAVKASRQTQPGLLWPVLHQIGAHLRAGTPLTDPERELIDRVMPLTPAWPYVCTRVDPIAFSPALDLAWATDHMTDLATLVVRLAARNPHVTSDHLLCNAMLAFRVTNPEAPLDYYEIAALSFDAAGTPLTQSVLVPEHEQAPGPVTVPDVWPLNWIVQYVRWSLESQQQPFFWRSALVTYIGLVSCLIAIAKLRDIRVGLVLVPAMATVIPLVLLTVGQAFRLVYPMYVVGLALLPLAWARKPLVAEVPDFPS